MVDEFSRVTMAGKAALYKTRLTSVRLRRVVFPSELEIYIYRLYY